MGVYDEGAPAGARTCAWIRPDSSIQDARTFLDDTEAKLMVLSEEAARANWVHSNFITFDTEAMASATDQRSIDEGVRLAKGATRFDPLNVPPRRWGAR